MANRMLGPTVDAAALRAAHRRYPGDTLGGLAGSLADGTLGALGGRGGSEVSYLVAGARYTLRVYDGAPERLSSWEATPGVLLPEVNITGRSREPGPAPEVPAPAGKVEVRSTTTGFALKAALGMVAAVVVGLLVAALTGGKS